MFFSGHVRFNGYFIEQFLADNKKMHIRNKWLFNN